MTSTPEFAKLPFQVRNVATELFFIQKFQQLDDAGVDNKTVDIPRFVFSPEETLVASTRN